MTDRSITNDAGQGDVQGFLLAFFIGAAIGYGVTKSLMNEGDGGAAWLGQQALTTAQNGRGILGAGSPK